MSLQFDDPFDHFKIPFGTLWEHIGNTLGTILPIFLHSCQIHNFICWNHQMIIMLKNKWGKRKGQSCKWLCVPIIEQMKMGSLPFNNIVSYDQRWLIDTLVVEIVIVCHRIGIAKGRRDPRVLLHFWVFQHNQQFVRKIPSRSSSFFRGLLRWYVRRAILPQPPPNYIGSSKKWSHKREKL